MSNHRYWLAVMYPENMVDDWENQIYDILQLPFAYCIHKLDQDSKSEHRKDHVHIILVFPNTTTEKHAKEVFERLNAKGKKAFNKIESCVSIRGAYDYLIHDTEGARKAGKYLYDKSARITGNNFDIGSYEQISIADKRKMVQELQAFILDRQIYNFVDFLEAMNQNFPDEYYDVMIGYNAFLERVCKGIFLKKFGGIGNGKNNI